MRLILGRRISLIFVHKKTISSTNYYLCRTYHCVYENVSKYRSNNFLVFLSVGIGLHDNKWKKKSGWIDSGLCEFRLSLFHRHKEGLVPVFCYVSVDTILLQNLSELLFVFIMCDIKGSGENLSPYQNRFPYSDLWTFLYLYYL